jgi:hypothetical protein
VGVVALDETRKSKQEILLSELVEDSDVAGKLRLRLVVKLRHSLSAEADVDDQEGLTLVHQTDHHYLVLLNVWKFERLL